jgi:hypothetical protein
MAQRPSFDMSKLSTADKILLGAGILFFIDTFLPWQRVCVEFLDVRQCGSASAWGGNGAIFGVLAGIFSILLIAWVGMQVAGVRLNLNLNMPPTTITAALGGLVVVFALLKFLLVIGNFVGFAAFIGLLLAIALAYGAYMKWQESRAGYPPSTAPPGPVTGPAAPPPGT